ncbi:MULTISPECIES: class I SAM-dependent methyltransferase [Paenibacillus]|uniref:Methyltransferase domain-containing protein n=1 Tax=Paenibacillus campinasensis TaxID=66347 RepID=A0ABW9T6W5_9BACL|nr:MULTISPECIES: class I SAM-dependent methyltransferase [Paenibacillus]MUG68473.1 methyltransferase domain-containing protein [Paenibacillus campinasensis]PAK50317.1 SAM-dependent methyltransferase [Paenibacillus sp. 7541]
MTEETSKVPSATTVPEGNRLSNVQRFNGFQDTYDQHRPEAPQEVVTLLTQYLGHRPSLVVDIGSGTGLSSFVWRDTAARIIGVEPNDDMRSKAVDKLMSLAGAPTDDQVQAAEMSFVPGYSNQLELPDGAAEIVTCSQSFHWMEPVSTLKEIARVLREGGIFAAYDCDWPPSLDWQVELAYHELIELSEQLIDRHVDAAEQAYKGNKDEHLKHIRESGHFRFTKEIVFHHTEPFTAERYIGLAVSQGGIQTVFKLNLPEIHAKLDQFQALVTDYFQGRTLPLMFSYRMRIGIK